MTAERLFVLVLLLLAGVYVCALHELFAGDPADRGGPVAGEPW